MKYIYAHITLLIIISSIISLGALYNDWRELLHTTARYNYYYYNSSSVTINSSSTIINLFERYPSMYHQTSWPPMVMSKNTMGLTALDICAPTYTIKLTDSMHGRR